MGGWHATDFMHKLLQLKYPHFPVRITQPNAQTLLYQHSHVAEDYLAELRAYEDFDELERRTTVFQYEYEHLVSVFNFDLIAVYLLMFFFAADPPEDGGGAGGDCPAQGGQPAAHD